MPENSAFTYARAFSTAICLETAADEQPFVAASRRLCGYDVEDLAVGTSFVECLYLLLTGDIPERASLRVLEFAMLGVMNLGPRDSANRAAMVAGASKSKTQHILPIGLMAGGGENHGAADVAKAYKFIKVSMSSHGDDEISQSSTATHFPSGFGQRYSACDPVMDGLLKKLVGSNPACPVLSWVLNLHEALSAKNAGILDTGLVAAACLSAGIGERESIGVYQIARAPGIFAQGAEQSHKPITAMPVPSDDEVRLVRE